MIAFEPRASSLNVTHASNRKSQAIQNLSSGTRQDIRRRDPGAFSMNSSIHGQVASERKLIQNMQSMISYAQVQDGTLQQMNSLVLRMAELASLATDTLQSNEDRELYNKEYLELVTQFNGIQNQTFNDIKLFGSGFSEEKEQFLTSLKENWLKASEDLIKQEYGWDPNPNDSWDLIVNVSDTGPYAAFVMTSWDGTGTADVKEMQFDLPDFNSPHTQPASTADTIVAHEMVHLMQAQNSYFGDLIGDGLSGGTEATWFKEGLAEFIYGADDRVSGILSAGSSDAEIDTFTAAINTGNESWTTSNQYATGYLAVRYLHQKIKDAGLGGIKHMTSWMKSQFNTSQGSANSGINAYFSDPLHGAIGYTDNNSFLADYKGSNGRDFIKNNILPQLNNTDTGSVGGSDANPSAGTAPVNKQDVVPDAFGAPVGSYVEETDGQALTISYTGDGDQVTLNPVSPISFDDNYNLSTVSSATSTSEYIRTLIDTIASNRAIVGANMSITQNSIESLRHRTLSLEKSISRINDAVIAEETENISKGDLLLGLSLSMNLQARQTSASIVLSLLS